jgi:cytochrome b involved in lipid metabolism
MSTAPFVVKHDGKKHNIEHFLRFHPGGTNTLSFLKNADVTDRLLATHHSAAAYELLKDYRVDEEDVHKHIREDGDLEVSDSLSTKCIIFLLRILCLLANKFHNISI